MFKSLTHSVRMKNGSEVMGKHRGLTAFCLTVFCLMAFCLAGLSGCSRSIEDSPAPSDVQEQSVQNNSAAKEQSSVEESGELQESSELQESGELQESSKPEESAADAENEIVPEHYEDESDFLYGLESEAAVLLRDGIPISGKNSEKTMYPASITKLMTALVAYDHLDPDGTITMTGDIINTTFEQDLTIAGFIDGDNISVRDCFYGLLVPSGAECALLFAEQVAGSEEEFAVLMNEKAAELGLTGTHFTNPHGAHDNRQVTTALDAARLLEAVLENPFLREVVCTPVYTTAPSENYPEGLTFHHVLVYYLHGDDDWPFGDLIYGGKTGTTTPAGKCLVSFSEIGGRTYILATLGAYEEGSGQVRDALTVYERLKDRYEPKEEMM